MSPHYVQLSYFCGCFLVFNLVFAVLGGFLALYRAAVADEISAHGKIIWFLLVTFLPLAALFYFLLRERNQKILILGTLLSLMGYGLAGYLLYEVPWMKHYASYYDVMTSLQLENPADKDVAFDINAADEGHPDPLNDFRARRTSTLKPAQVRNNDDISRKAQQISEELLILYNNQKDKNEQKSLNDLDISLGNLRWEYIYDSFSSDSANQLLDELEVNITAHSLTTQSIKAWQDKVRLAIDDNEITNLFKAPDSAPSSSGSEPPIPESDPANPDYYRHLESLLLARQFDELETLAQTYRSQDQHALGGGVMLNSYYNALSAVKDDCHCRRYETLVESQTKEEALHDWLKTNPDSLTAHIAFASFEIANAWKERGQSYGRDVPKEQWKKYELHLSHAEEYIKDLDPHKDSQIYIIDFNLMADSPKAKKQLEQLYAAVKKNFPTRYDAYSYYGNYIQPKWFGSRPELTSFVQKLSLDLGPENGAMAYVFVADTLSRQYHVQDIYSKTGLEWDFIKQAYQFCEKRYGLTPEEWNSYLYFALASSDKREAQRALGHIHNQWDPHLWSDKVRRAELVAWAYDSENNGAQHE